MSHRRACCCGCSYCSNIGSASPRSVIVSITDHVLCYTCRQYVGEAFHAVTLESGSLNGTYALPWEGQDLGISETCSWRLRLPYAQSPVKAVSRLYDGVSDCQGTLLEQLDLEMTLQLVAGAGSVNVYFGAWMRTTQGVLRIWPLVRFFNLGVMPACLGQISAANPYTRPCPSDPCWHWQFDLEAYCPDWGHGGTIAATLA